MRERARPRLVVLGSVHMDLIATAERLPAPGESVSGGVFAMAPGGKGGNQACQFALAGADTFVVTRLGDDAFGRELLTALGGKGVDTSLVAIDPDAPTGASSVLAAEGDYASIIAPGAAGLLSREDIDRARPAIATADALVVQLEIAAEISAYAAFMAAEAGTAVVLNASPAPLSWPAIPDALRNATSHLFVNRVEAARLLAREPDTMRGMDVVTMLAQATGVGTVVMTLGAEGSIATANGDLVRQPAFEAIVADAVGAGDAFLGICVAALLEGRPLAEALRRGAAAGAIAVSRSGVYEALPSADEVDAFLSGRG